MLIPYAPYVMAMFLLVVAFIVTAGLGFRSKLLHTQLRMLTCSGTAAVAIGLLHFVTADVYRIGHYNDCEHWRAIGDPPFDRDDDVDFAGDDWVINETDHDLRLVTVEYGRLGGEPTERIVPPNKMAHTRSIDYVGPSSPPPNQLRISDRGPEAKLDFAMRTWLTW